jgi:hypothetical protein
MNYIQPSFLFSYWLFGWFIIYILSKYLPSIKWVHNYTNPIYGFYIGVLENLIQIYLIYKNNLNWKLIGFFMLNMLLFKIIPILFLFKEPVNFYWNSIFLISLFFVYLFYLVMSGTNIYNIYKETSDSIIKGENKTPFMFMINHIFNLYEKMNENKKIE